MKKRFFYILFLMVLILGTLLLLVWHHFGMNKELRVINGSESFYHVYDINDQVNGGLSTTSVRVENNALRLTCEIKQSEYKYPYCGLTISFKDDKQGVDLSVYDSAKLHLGYQNSPNDKIIVRMKNRNPAYTTDDGDFLSEKFNSVEYNPSVEGQLKTIPLSYFHVPEWWIAAYHIPIALSMPEYNNVTRIEITTGYGISFGNHEIWIKELTFTGKVISYEKLVTLILIVWFLSGLVMLATVSVQVRKAYQRDKKQLSELRDINRALNLQSQKLERQAKVDPLTGALNRLGVRKELLLLQSKTANQNFDLSFIFVDIDGFKTINEIHGHNIGDEVLIEIAKLFQKRMCSNDLVVRWRGKGFLLVCPQIALKEASEIAESTRQCIEQYSWVEDISLTCSFGVGQLHPGEQMEGFIHRVDKALRNAKEHGRNCVQVSYL